MERHLIFSFFCHRLDTRYACVHFITDVRGLLSRGDQTFSRIKLADKRLEYPKQMSKRLKEEYRENLSRDVHNQNEFRLAQVKVVAKVKADPRFAVSLEKMALHTDPVHRKMFRMQYVFVPSCY